MQQPQYRQASKHLRALARRVDDFVGDGWTDDSPAAQRCRTEPAAGFWRDRPQRDASSTPPLLMLHSTDHFRAVAAAIDEPDVVMSMLSLIRPALESVATAYYLLDPGIAPAERLRRAINVELAAAVEQLRLMPAQERERKSPQWMEARHRIYWLDKHAPRHGLTLTRGRPYGGLEPDAWLGEKPPKAMILAEELFADIEGGANVAHTMHRLTSAVVHGQLHGLLFFLRPETAVSVGDGMSMARMGLDIQDFATWSAPLVYGLDRLLERACADFGWPRAQWDRVARPALVDWGNWMR